MCVGVLKNLGFQYTNKGIVAKLGSDRTAMSRFVVSVASAKQLLAINAHEFLATSDTHLRRVAGSNMAQKLRNCVGVVQCFVSTGLPPPMPKYPA